MKKIILFIVVSIAVLYAGIKIESYLTFDGNDTCIGAKTDFRNSDTKGAVVAWVRPTDATNSGAIFSFANNGFSTNHMKLSFTTNSRFGMRINNGSTTNYPYSPNSTITVNTDMLIAGMSDGDNYLLNYNGNNITVSMISGTDNGIWFDEISNENHVALGVLNRTTPDSYGKMRLYQVAVYSDTLDRDLLAACYAAGNTAELPATNRVAYWKINDNSNTVVDADGGVNMTVSGAAWTVFSSRKNTEHPQTTGYPKW